MYSILIVNTICSIISLVVYLIALLIVVLVISDIKHAGDFLQFVYSYGVAGLIILIIIVIIFVTIDWVIDHRVGRVSHVSLSRTVSAIMVIFQWTRSWIITSISLEVVVSDSPKQEIKLTFFICIIITEFYRTSLPIEMTNTRSVIFL